MGINCPVCRAMAVYRYGKTKNGRQRYRCLMCGHQFTPDRQRNEVEFRPDCPLCGRKMHAYRKCAGGLRFRCSGYPTCREYKKVITKEGLTG